MRSPVALLCLSLAVPVLAAQSPTATAASCPAHAPGTSVHYTTSQQVMVADRTFGSRGTWARYEWRGISKGCWVKVSAASTARFGSGGVVPAARRRQNTNTTPAGNFAIKYAFGEGNPGTRIAYRRITARSVWVKNPRLKDYNRWRENSTLSGRGIGEDLSRYRDRGLYRQAAVIGYNYDRPVRYGAGSGSGIFLHYSSTATGGCIGLTNRRELNRTIAWLDPAKKPRMVIKA